jgi:DNA-binding transcriptional LysR family regulator
MELRHLRYFVKVASELHFGRAAEQLGISQPPLSQQIRLLEQELGVQLFERTSRKVLLTTAGRLFLDEAKATLAQADHAVSVTRRAASGEIGELTVGLSASTLYVPMVSDAISVFRASHPDVHLVFTELSIAAQRDSVASGALDIGFVRSRNMPFLPDDVAAAWLVTDRMYVAMPKGHRLSQTIDPIRIAALADEPMVHYPYDREGFLDDLHHLFGNAGLRPKLVLESNEMSTLLGLVAAGLGITVLPGSLRRLEVDTLHYREIEDEHALSSMWLIHHARRAGPVARAFIDLLLPGRAT